MNIFNTKKARTKSSAILLAILTVFFALMLTGGVFAPPTPCSITVNSPDGGEVWKGTNSITWTASNCGGGNQNKFDIFYSTNSGSSYTQVSNDYAGVGGANSYSWNTAAQSDSNSAKIKVCEKDGTSHCDQSNANFKVDNTAPTASVTSPIGIISGTVTITADASDSGSGIAKVEFWYASVGTKIGEDTSAPYSISLDTTALSNGDHNLWVVAYDNAGNSVTSSLVQVTVNNCGDGVINSGEQCEAPFDACCDAGTCQFKSSSTECRISQGQCDAAETCTGSSASCPADSKSTAECRPAAGQCDLAENCDGVNNDCPADVFKAADTSCNDGLFCNVDEVCDGNGNCGAGTAKDCSSFDISAIASCFNSPDDNQYTWDLRSLFLSVCDENNDVCTTGSETITHSCDVSQCSAECDATHSCSDNTCSETYNDYCSGSKLSEYNLNGILDSTTVTDSCSNTCQDSCSCSNCGTDCSAPSINTQCSKSQCGAECETNGDCQPKCEGNIYYSGGVCDTAATCSCSYSSQDCDESDGWYDTGITQWIDTGQCTQKEQKQQEYRDYSCGDGCLYQVTDSQWIDTENTQNKPDTTVCDDGLFCTSDDQCTAGVCGGAAKSCSDGVSCTQDSCDENNDVCINSPDNSVCDNGLWCDGQETCDAVLDCQAGITVDCSENNIFGISSCTNSPDNNPLTFDFRDSFISQCVNGENPNTGSCTTSENTGITHTCDIEGCNAQCQDNSNCDDGKFWTTDTCLDACTCEHLNLDTIAPTTSASAYFLPSEEDYTFNTWTNQTVYISLSASDNEGGSGVPATYGTYYCVDTANECDPTTAYDAEVGFSVSDEGTSYVRFYSTDNAGNTEEIQSKIVNIDKTNPIFSFLQDIIFTKNDNDTTSTSLEINASSNVNSPLTITNSTSDPSSSSVGIPELGKYVKIEAPGLNGNMNEVLIKVYYTDAEVSAKGIIESTLRLWYYNSTSATWTKYDAPNGGVDTVENYVWALTNHFSTWGVFGNTPAPATTSNSAGGGGSGGSCSPSWSCSEWSACSSSGIQTRTCTNAKSYCPGIKPATEQSCTYNAPTPSPIQQPVQSIQQRPITETIQPLQFQNTGLTGAVIGVATNPIGIAGIVASLAIIAGAIFFGFSFIPNLNKVKK